MRRSGSAAGPTHQDCCGSLYPPHHSMDNVTHSALRADARAHAARPRRPRRDRRAPPRLECARHRHPRHGSRRHPGYLGGIAGQPMVCSGLSGSGCFWRNCLGAGWVSTAAEPGAGSSFAALAASRSRRLPPRTDGSAHILRRRLLSPFDWHWFTADFDAHPRPLPDGRPWRRVVFRSRIGRGSAMECLRSSFVLMLTNYGVCGHGPPTRLFLAPRLLAPPDRAPCEGASPRQRVALSTVAGDAPTVPPAEGRVRCLIVGRRVPSFLVPV